MQFLTQRRKVCKDEYRRNTFKMIHFVLLFWIDITLIPVF